MVYPMLEELIVPAFLESHRLVIRHHNRVMDHPMSMPGDKGYRDMNDVGKGCAAAQPQS